MEFIHRQNRIKNKDRQLDQTLIKNLFQKYPDLQYETISRQKFQGEDNNSYSYAYGFINEQKKLIKSGYTVKKSFEIV